MKTRTYLILALLIGTFMMNVSLVSLGYARTGSAQAEAEFVEVPVVNINASSAEELQMISGIGPKLAAMIIQYREENGTFEIIEDIMKVRGVGNAKFAKIKDHLRV